MKRDIELTDEYVVHGSLGMTRGSVLRIEDGQDMAIYVWEGGIWLTQEGDHRDRYLGAGDCFKVERDGVTLAQATEGSTLSLTAPQSELYAKRIAMTKAGTGIQAELYASPLEASSFWTRLFAPYSQPTAASL
ncbi:MAG TPA: DUF2917 domain-containing protein [Burkholderiales bacterium]|nr:DUF2917 domain-containing protein [Burkholderiales bacterium]